MTMKKFILTISVMAAFAAAFTSCVKEEIVGTADGDGLYLNKAEITLVKGNSETLVATVTPKGSATVKWESADAAVATVDKDGKVTAVGAGETTVTVSKEDGAAVECLVQVQSPVTVLTLDKEEVFIYKGEETEIAATVGPDDINVPFKYTWISSDESVFEVVPDSQDPSKAVVRGLMGGFATLYVQAGDVTTSIPVTIDVDLAGIVITGAPTGKIYKGESFYLGVEKDPIDAIDELSPVWSSSDENVLTVDQTGLVTATGAGTATIKVESNGFEATLDVTVNVLATVSFYPTSKDYAVNEDLRLVSNVYGLYGSYMYVRSNNTMTFSVPEGLKITEIVFTPYNSYYSLYMNADNGTYESSSYTWTGESNEVTFTVTSSYSYVKGFKVTYKD